MKQATWDKLLYMSHITFGLLYLQLTVLLSTHSGVLLFPIIRIWSTHFCVRDDHAPTEILLTLTLSSLSLNPCLWLPNDCSFLHLQINPSLSFTVTTVFFQNTLSQPNLAPSLLTLALCCSYFCWVSLLSHSFLFTISWI